ncbi:hypothetical protein RZS08_21620, partial [Arthrospira platensis SPKY1]|nr:hypothetical protein [Arthrospira platensis SPKY1]
TSPVAAGEIIEYFVVAQDLRTTPNVGSNAVVYNACGIPASVALDGSLFPVSGINSFTIIAEPMPITATAAPDEVCVIDDVTLSISPSNLGAEYQWESSPAGANIWTPIPGATSTTYVVTGLSVSTDYRCVISCGGVPI